MRGVSETSRIRDIAMPFINEETDQGLDIGFGGDAICPTSTNLDLPNRYSNCGKDEQHISADASDLSFMEDDKWDYIFSSHCLEDFENTEAVTREWIRVLKPGGKILLYLPNEGFFQAWAARTNQPVNPHHKNPAMGLEYMREVFGKIDQTMELFAVDRHEVPGWQHPGMILDYSFFIVVEKL